MTKHSDMTGEQATARGYRKVSNSYLRVARIDRPDWLEVLANEMMRAPADFIVRSGPLKGKVSGGWCDYYRRGMTKDVIVLAPQEFKKVPSSCGDPTGYVR